MSQGPGFFKLPKVPADFEFNIDHQMVEMAAWDHVSIDDLLHCFEHLATLPGNLDGSVQYLDLSEASTIMVSESGAVQLGKVYEDLLDRGLRGMVIFAPDEEVAGKAGMIMTTLAELSGDFPDGFYIIRAPMPAEKVRAHLAKTQADSDPRPVHGLVLRS